MNPYDKWCPHLVLAGPEAVLLAFTDRMNEVIASGGDFAPIEVWFWADLVVTATQRAVGLAA